MVWDWCQVPLFILSATNDVKYFALLIILASDIMGEAQISKKLHWFVKYGFFTSHVPSKHGNDWLIKIGLR